MIRRMTSKGSDIARQLRAVNDRISAAAQRRPKHLKGPGPRLVAVSKTKPVEMILEAYACGQRNFGENYVQELVDKGSNQEILQKCGDVKWHFIGNLQRNKVNKVTGVAGLYMVETVYSEKLAQALDNAWSKQSHAEPLAVMVQVNTSNEENKNGVDPSEAVSLSKYVHQECPHLRLAGLMTIGSVENSTSDGVNPDFQCLCECRKAVSEALGMAELELELSMGMSQDFERAIEAGSTNIRVGSTIFGARQYPTNQNTSDSHVSMGPLTGQGGDSSDPEAAKCAVSDIPTDLNNLSLNG
ncbi:pyridoxal phosphate homeostasis protein-like [Babylonia areolata]|uniref:pyridoxal phosphate homeostasis protein-like n=1 Tax=Babylonia areolata TaxID=304850 RepID=UPI003FCF9F48